MFSNRFTNVFFYILHKYQSWNCKRREIVACCHKYECKWWSLYLVPLSPFKVVDVCQSWGTYIYNTFVLMKNQNPILTLFFFLSTWFLIFVSCYAQYHYFSIVFSKLDFQTEYIQWNLNPWTFMSYCEFWIY